MMLEIKNRKFKEKIHNSNFETKIKFNRVNFGVKKQRFKFIIL